MLTNLTTLLAKASAGGYAVGAFNSINLEFAEAVVNASRACRAPVILNIAEAHFPYVTPEFIIPAIKAMIRPGDPDLVINLDHGLTFESVVHALDSGFTSVMFDGSKYSYEENVRLTGEIVRIAHQKGISVEAELGAVGGDEGGGLAASADPELFTDPMQALDFVTRTGCDALAVAIGNVHGAYRGDPDLDFARLEKIRKTVAIPLVLHGGSGISDADFHRAIDIGISKINFFTGMAQAALDATRHGLTGELARYNAFPDIMRIVKQAVQQTVEEQIRIFGNGKFN